MTMQDFIREHDRYGFVERKLADMKKNISKMDTISKTDTLNMREFKECIDSADRCYYTIYGYIIALFYHGGIKEDEYNALSDELIGLSIGKDTSAGEVVA